MKKILFFIPIFFMIALVNAQEQEVPAVPEIPAISEDKEEEEVIKVEIVNNSSLDAAFPMGENELRLNALSFLAAAIAKGSSTTLVSLKKLVSPLASISGDITTLPLAIFL